LGSLIWLLMEDGMVWMQAVCVYGSIRAIDMWPICMWTFWHVCVCVCVCVCAFKKMVNASEISAGL